MNNSILDEYDDMVCNKSEFVRNSKGWFQCVASKDPDLGTELVPAEFNEHTPIAHGRYYFDGKHYKNKEAHGKEDSSMDGKD